MKGKITILAGLGFIIFFAIEAQAVDWVFYGTSEENGNSHYYDPQSVKRVSKDVVRVWGKSSYSEKGAQDVIKKDGSKYNGLSYIIFWVEYDCSEKKSYNLSVTLYNQDGGVIESSNNDSSWESIVPGAVSEALFNIVCGSR